MRSIGIGMLGACALALAISGCDKAPGRPGPDSAAQRPEEELRFDVLYHRNCSGCHGADGKDGAAIDLANPRYQALVDDQLLRKWISKGMPQTQMPAFAISAGGYLTDKQIDVLVQGMRQRWVASPDMIPANLPPYVQPEDADANRGQQVFQRSCASCHKSPNDEITSPTYLALMSDQALRSIIIVDRPAFAQHDRHYADPGADLSNQEISDVVKYLSTLRTSTPGQPYPEAREGAE